MGREMEKQPMLRFHKQYRGRSTHTHGEGERERTFHTSGRPITTTRDVRSPSLVSEELHPGSNQGTAASVDVYVSPRSISVGLVMSVEGVKECVCVIETVIVRVRH